MSDRRLLGAVFLSLSITGCIAEPIPPPSSSPSPSDVISFATTLPSAADGSATATIAVPRTSVAAAVAIRDAGVDRRELDVAGFLSRTPVLACPVILADTNPTRLDCPQNFQWLMAKPEELEHQTAEGYSLGPPTGPAIRPSFALVDQPQPLEWRVGADKPAPAAPVEVIGHFDDRRAALCGRDQDPQLRCADTFVVDQIVAVDGRPVGVTTSEDLVGANDARVQPVSAVEDIDQLVANAEPGLAILSRRVLLARHLTAIEPGIRAGLFESPIVWSVVGLDPSTGPPAVARTFLVRDGGSEAIVLPNDEPGSAAPQPAPS